MSSALDVTDNMWETTVLKSDTPVLVDFWAEWCGPCKAMSPYVDKLAQELGDRIKVVKLNIQENQQVPANYSIISIPTFLLIKEGEVVHRVVGAKTDFKAFKAEIEAHL
jgi:thioredoxin 1